MNAVFAFCVPPLILIFLRKQLLPEKTSGKTYLINYLKTIVMLNWIMLMILFYFFHSGGNILSKLNNHLFFAVKYSLLSIFISIAAVITELILHKKGLLKNHILYTETPVSAKPLPKQKTTEKNKSFRNKHAVFTFFLYGLFLLLMILTISGKKSYHVDEMYSYGLANHQNGINIQLEDGKKYIPSTEPYLEYLTVSRENRFDYENVWINQINDVHPPLYYLLLHTICSVFSGTFSNWYAGIINIIFALFTLYVFRKLIRILTANNEKICSILSAAFILSPGILSAVSFFRMYILAMFLMTLLTFLLVKETDKLQPDQSFFQNLFWVSLAGALTHYYCIIYTVAACAIFCIILLIRKNWKSIGSFIAAGALSGSTAYMIFPAMITHMFSGYRGTEALDNLKQSPSEFIERSLRFFEIINKDLFGNLIGIFFFVIAAVFIIYLLKKYQSKNLLFKILPSQTKAQTAVFEKPMILSYVIALLPAFLYFLFVSKAAAYITDRYMFPIYAILFACFTGFISISAKAFLQNKTAISFITVFLLLLTGNGWNHAQWPYLYRSTADLMTNAETCSNVDCLYIYDVTWRTEPSFAEIKNYRSITFLQQEHLEQLSSLDIADQQQLIVMIIGDPEETLQEIYKAYPQFTCSKELGTSWSTTTYFIN